MSILIRRATSADIPHIQSIAHTTWPITFADILPPGQIAYMLDMMYSTASLTAQIEQKNHVFHLAIDDGTPIGYISHELNYLSPTHYRHTKIHKIYLLPGAQRRGGGGELIKTVRELAVAGKQTALQLNVNKYNQALGFYQRLGFVVVGYEDIDIGDGFLMEDAKLVLPLAQSARSSI